MIDFSQFHLGEDARILSEGIPGPESKRMLQLQREIEGRVVSYPRSNPIAIRRAKGAIIEDVDGNRFIDFFAGAGVVNLGHSNEEVLEYVTEQQKDIIHCLDFPTENKLSAIQKILSHLPPSIRHEYKVSFGGPTGSDAVEAAIKLAKIKTGRDTIIAFTGGYHGMSSAALAATSDTFFRQNISSLVSNIHFVPYGYCYRCPFEKKPSNCSMQCVNYLRNILENPHSGIPKPAAILLEPVQGEGGNIVPLEGYLESLVELAHAHDVIVIFDEIQSGFFRTGTFLSFMHGKAVPDIITISKGLGGIGLPISGLIYRKDVEAWGPGAHIGTFRGNQASLAGTNGAFDFIEKYNLTSYVNTISALLMDGLKDLQESCEVMGDVRGKGLMIGLEFVEDRLSKKPYSTFAKTFRRNCLQRGLLFELGGHYGNVIRLVPPLIITPKIVESAMRIMRSALRATEYELGRYTHPVLDNGVKVLNGIH